MEPIKRLCPGCDRQLQPMPGYMATYCPACDHERRIERLCTEIGKITVERHDASRIITVANCEERILPLIEKVRAEKKRFTSDPEGYIEDFPEA